MRGGSAKLTPPERVAAVARVRRAVATAADRRACHLSGRDGADRLQRRTRLDGAPRCAGPAGPTPRLAVVGRPCGPWPAPRLSRGRRGCGWAGVGAWACVPVAPRRRRAGGVAAGPRPHRPSPGTSCRSGPGRCRGDRARAHRRRPGGDGAHAPAGRGVAGGPARHGRARTRTGATVASGLARCDHRLLRRARHRAAGGSEQRRSEVSAQPGSPRVDPGARGGVPRRAPAAGRSWPIASATSSRRRQRPIRRDRDGGREPAGFRSGTPGRLNSCPRLVAA